MENTSKVIKGNEIITITAGSLLLLSYFLPWIQFLNLRFYGFELSSIISSTNELNESIGSGDGVINSVWFSLIHLIPVGAIVLIINSFAKIKKVGNIAVIIMSVVLIGINFSMFNNGIETSALGAGYMLAALGSVGIIYTFIMNFRMSAIEKDEGASNSNEEIVEILIKLLIFVFFLLVIVALYRTTTEYFNKAINLLSTQHKILTLRFVL